MGDFLFLGFILAWIFLVIFWVMMLVNAAQTGQWAWLILMVLFCLLAFVYYFVAYLSPEDQRREEWELRERARRRDRMRDEEVQRLRERVQALEEDLRYK